MIETKLHDDVLEIVIAHPPVNALGAPVRLAIATALENASSDDAVRAIVIRGDGKFFSAGADITEFNMPPSDPSLPELVDRIEASAKPVIAAIHGMALGGGLELALGCHYRVAAATAKLGLPEVKLGLLPGAGGTQRLPRLIGVAAALDMIVSGSPLSAKAAVETGLVDKLTDEDRLAEDAIAFAGTVSAPRPTGERTIGTDPDRFEKAASDVRRKNKAHEAPMACIEAVRAATELPFNEGLERERALFRQLVAGEESRALRHVFFAERAAAKIEGLPRDTPLRAVNSVGIIGAGTMGGGIAMNFLSAGIPVTIVDMQQEALDCGIAVVRKNYEASAAKGRLTEAQVEAAMAHLMPTLDFKALGQCDLVIEAVYETMEIKKAIFSRLDKIARSGALLASNTSFLSIDEIASATTRPQDVLGLHFFSPANVMKLVEVVRGEKTAPDAVATGMALARSIGKVPVVTGVCYGFIGNRMLIPRQGQAIQMLIEGATPEQIDRVHTGFGMPMGPFQMADLAGLDIGWHRDPGRIETLQDAFCAKGRWGQKTRAGYYDYDEHRKPISSEVSAGIIEAFRSRAGVIPRSVTDDEIVVRTLYTMVNEAAKILEEGIAQRASDIDVVWNYGYGWPRHKGGPMFWADTLGLDEIVTKLARYSAAMGQDFSVSNLLAKLARDEGLFNSVD